MTTIKQLQLTLTLIFGLIISTSANAERIFTSTGSGTWTSSGRWSQSGSGSIIKYVIQNGHTVNVNSNVGGIDTLVINGSLDFGNSKTINMLSTGYVFVSNTGTVTGGNASSSFGWNSGNTGQIDGPFNGSNTVNGPVFATISTLGFVPPTTPLPVVLIDFTASKNNNNIEISWKTSSELNNAYFGLERSQNGNDWNEIAQLKGNKVSNTITVYNYIDMNAEAGVQTYRLKQVDLDGSITYSKIVSVNATGATKNISDFIQSVYPNPSHGIINLNLTDAAANEGGKLVLMNAFGQVINTWENINSNNFSIDINNEEVGMYYLVFEVLGSSYTSKISKY